MAEKDKRLIALGKGSSGGGGDAVWGSIGGTISNQTDLMNELNGKASTSDIPTKTSDLQNDSGFREVIEVTDMTQAELLDFYTNYATLMTQNTYVVNGYPFSTLMVIDPQYGNVLILEYNPQFKDQAVGAASGTIDVTAGVVYIFADGSKQTTTLTYTVPQNSSLATVAKSGSYNDLLNKPSIPAAQVQSDWNQSDNTAVDYIKNKPSIPAAQVNSDWNASSGVAEILNKPTIPTVNDSTITIQQDGTTVGTFTTNDANDTTINLTGGGGNDWYGTQMQFDTLGTYDPYTNYYISDKLDYNTDLKNKPDLSVYATKTEVNTKNDQQDGLIAGKLGGVFMTQAEFDQITPSEGQNYFIEGQTVEVVVTFTDQTTATYNVVVD